MCEHPLLPSYVIAKRGQMHNPMAQAINLQLHVDVLVPLGANWLRPPQIQINAFRVGKPKLLAEVEVRCGVPARLLLRQILQLLAEVGPVPRVPLN